MIIVPDDRITIHLSSGRELRAGGFEFGYTYAGMLGGRPSEAFNRQIFKSLKHSSDWGKRKTLKLLPSEEEFAASLKPVYYIVWLTSSKPLDPEFMGSELVVIWLGDRPGDQSLRALVEDGVKAIDWAAHAKDFDL
jgi:hypothetical protein